MSKKQTNKLTQKQQEAVDYFKNYKRMFGQPPTFKRAGENFGVAAAVMRHRIISAEKKGVKVERYKREVEEN